MVAGFECGWFVIMDFVVFDAWVLIVFAVLRCVLCVVYVWWMFGVSGDGLASLECGWFS